MGRGEEVSLSVLTEVCGKYDCNYNDLISFEKVQNPIAWINGFQYKVVWKWKNTAVRYAPGMRIIVRDKE